MTHWEITRLVCYTIGAPAGLYVVFHLVRARAYSWAVLLGGLALLWVWYMVEITIASTGVNTREYRVIGTPMVIVSTIALMVMAYQVRKLRRLPMSDYESKQGEDVDER